MAKCHGCTLVINQSYWFEILQTVIKSFEGWGQVIIFLLLELTLLVFSVSISSVYKICNQGAIMTFCHGVYADFVYSFL